jgi:hypothetical protein
MHIACHAEKQAFSRRRNADLAQQLRSFIGAIAQKLRSLSTRNDLFRAQEQSAAASFVTATAWEEKPKARFVNPN